MNRAVLTVCLTSRSFDILAGHLTLAREPSADLQIAWSGSGRLVEQCLKELDYDGVPGRLVGWCTDLRMRRREDGKEFIIQVLTVVHQLSRDEVAVGRVTIELQEHVVVTVRAVDDGHRPISGAPLKVLGAVPESTSISGNTDEDGQFSFLARDGVYSLVLGGARHPPIHIAANDAGERLVVVTVERSR